jgi:hypothetical protein
MTDDTLKKLKKIFAVKWVVFIMLSVSIVFYFFLAVILKKMEISFINDERLVMILRNVFSFFAAVMLFISFYARRNLKDPEKFIRALSKRNFDSRLILRSVEHIDDQAIKKLGAVILYSNTLDIISWVLLEAIAILGLVLFMLSMNVMYIQAFGAVALLALAFSRPDFQGFLNLIEEAKREVSESGGMNENLDFD